METKSVAAPGAAGTYTARFAVWDEVPASCTESDGALSCSGPRASGGFETTYELCPAGRVVEVTFDLRESGDVTVPVDVSP